MQEKCRACRKRKQLLHQPMASLRAGRLVISVDIGSLAATIL